METNNDKISNVLDLADRLIEDQHFAADKIKQKADSIRERYAHRK